MLTGLREPQKVGDFPAKTESSGTGCEKPSLGWDQDLCHLNRNFPIPQNPAWVYVQEPHGPHPACAEARVCGAAVAEEGVYSSLSLVGGFCLLVCKCKSEAAWKIDNMETAKLN